MESKNIGGRPLGKTAPSSDAVKRVRLKLDITQVDMAARLGLSEKALQRLERLGRLPSSAGPRAQLKQMAEDTGEIFP